MRRGKIFSIKTDIRMALSHAHAFHHQVQQLLANVPDDVEGANAYLAANPGRTTFIATNLIFASELYLKIALIAGGNKVPTKHNLWTIFCRIPDRDQQVIEREFQRRFAQAPQALSMHMLLTTEKGLSQADVLAALKLDEADSPKGDFFSLRRILKDTGESYQTWRYLFQSIREGNSRRVLRFHWAHLNCLCDVLDSLMREALNSDRIPVPSKTE